MIDGPAGRVVVLGSVNVDLVARTAVLPRAGETVRGSSFTTGPGGKGANTAVAAARAGAEVVLCGAVGTDGFGDDALRALAHDGVGTDRVARVDEPTGAALIVVDESGQNAIVVVAGANGRARGGGFPWRPGDVAAAVCEVPVAAVERFLAEARAARATTFLNATPATAAVARLLSLCDVVCVNEGEQQSLGASLGGSPRPSLGAAALVVTLGSGGIRLVDAEGEFALPAHAVEVVDTVGAGDAVCGVLVAGLAAGRSLRESVVRANAAGALAVRGAGARSSPTATDIDEFLGA